MSEPRSSRYPHCGVEEAAILPAAWGSDPDAALSPGSIASSTRIAKRIVRLALVNLDRDGLVRLDRRRGRYSLTDEGKRLLDETRPEEGWTEALRQTT